MDIKEDCQRALKDCIQILIGKIDDIQKNVSQNQQSMHMLNAKVDEIQKYCSQTQQHASRYDMHVLIDNIDEIHKKGSQTQIITSRDDFPKLTDIGDNLQKNYSQIQQFASREDIQVLTVKVEEIEKNISTNIFALRDDIQVLRDKVDKKEMVSQNEAVADTEVQTAKVEKTKEMVSQNEAMTDTKVQTAKVDKTKEMVSQNEAMADTKVQTAKVDGIQKNISQTITFKADDTHKTSLQKQQHGSVDDTHMLTAKDDQLLEQMKNVETKINDLKMQVDFISDNLESATATYPKERYSGTNNSDENTQRDNDKDKGNTSPKEVTKCHLHRSKFDHKQLCMKRAIQMNILHLVEQLPFAESELQDMLITSGCITEDECSGIKAHKTSKDQVRNLLRLIKGRSFHVMNKFLDNVKSMNPDLAERVMSTYLTTLNGRANVKRTCTYCNLKKSVDLKILADHVWSAGIISEILYDEIVSTDFPSSECWMKFADECNQNSQSRRAIDMICGALEQKGQHTELLLKLRHKTKLECSCNPDQLPAKEVLLTQDSMLLRRHVISCSIEEASTASPASSRSSLSNEVMSSEMGSTESVDRVHFKQIVIRLDGLSDEYKFQKNGKRRGDRYYTAMNKLPDVDEEQSPVQRSASFAKFSN